MGSSMELGFGTRGSSGRYTNDAEAAGKGAVKAMLESPLQQRVVLASALRDSSAPGAFPAEEVYRTVARTAGFDLTTRVVHDRRGYLHQLLLVRRGVN